MRAAALSSGLARARRARAQAGRHFAPRGVDLGLFEQLAQALRLLADDDHALAALQGRAHILDGGGDIAG